MFATYHLVINVSGNIVKGETYGLFQIYSKES